MPAEFPLVARYELGRFNLPQGGEAPREPLYARIPEQGSLPSEEEWTPHYDRQAAVRAWLLRMGDKATRTSVAGLSLRLQWSDEVAARREIERERPVMAAEFAAMIQELLAKGVLTIDEAKTASPRIWIQVDDQRGDTRQKLPDLNEPAQGAGKRT